MTENSLRERIGVLLILLHFGVLALIFISFLNGGFRFDELTTSIAIIAPMFAGYTTAIVIHFSRNRFKARDTSQEVTSIFAVMSAAFPLAFFAALITCVLLFSTSRVFANFEEFKGTLTLLEAIFAAYVANFVYTLFEKQKPADEKHSNASGNPRADMVIDDAMSSQSTAHSTKERSGR